MELVQTLCFALKAFFCNFSSQSSPPPTQCIVSTRLQHVLTSPGQFGLFHCQCANHRNRERPRHISRMGVACQHKNTPLWRTPNLASPGKSGSGPIETLLPVIETERIGILPQPKPNQASMCGAVNLYHGVSGWLHMTTTTSRGTCVRYTFVKCTRSK